MSRVGNTMKLKIDCLENKKGTIGVVFNDYGDGVQVIFPNGKYDGFHSEHERMMWKNQTELDFFLEKVGFDPLLSNYRFTNVMQVEKDFRVGVFFK